MASQSKSKPKRTATVKKPASKKAVVVPEPPKGRYINPLTDYGFKRIFGNSLLLKDFLNNVLELPDKIVRLHYVNVEQKGRTKNERDSFYDLHCTTSKGDYIIIEMQYLPQPFFKDRVVFYAAQQIQKQAKKGKWNYKLKAVYSISMLNFKISDDEDDNKGEYHHCVQLTYNRTKRVFYKKMTFLFIELSEFNKTEAELQNDYDWWLYILKHLPELNEMPQAVNRSRVFKQLSEEAEIANMTPEELNLYDISLKNLLNQMTPEDIVKSYQKELAASQKIIEAREKAHQKELEVSRKIIAEYQRRYGALSGAHDIKPRATQVRARNSAKARETADSW